MAAHPLRGRGGDRLRHRALLLAGDHHEQLPAAPRTGAGRRLAAHLLRPAVPPDARKLLLPAFTKTAVAKQEAATRAFCHTLIDEFAGPGRRRCRPRLRSAHPDAGHRRHARLPAGGRPAVPRVRRGRAGGHQLCRRTNASSGSTGCSTTCSSRSRPPRPPARGPDQLSASTPRCSAPSCEADHVVGTMALLLIAGIDTTWSAIGASLWHLAQTPGGPRAAGRRTRPGADRDGGVPPGLRAGHHGPPGQGGHALARRRHEGRRLDPAVVPGRQPGPGPIRPGR